MVWSFQRFFPQLFPDTVVETSGEVWAENVEVCSCHHPEVSSKAMLKATAAPKVKYDAEMKKMCKKALE